MGFLVKHRSRVTKRTTIPRSKIDPGTMIEFRYEKVKGGKVEENLVGAIVLSVWPPAGALKEKLVHGLSLDMVSDNHLRRFAQIIGAPSVDEDVENPSGGNMVKFNLTTGRIDASKFYDTKLTKISGLVETAYRTYKMDKMGQVRVLDYDFKNIIPTQFRGDFAD